MRKSRYIAIGVGVVMALGIGIVAAGGLSSPPNPTVKAIPLHISNAPPVSSVTSVVTGSTATTETNAPSGTTVVPSVTATSTPAVVEAPTVASTIPATTAACSFTFESFTTGDNRPALGVFTYNACTPATITMTYSDASGVTFTVSSAITEANGMSGSTVLIAPAYSPDGTHSTSLVRASYSFNGVTGGYSAAQLPAKQLIWGTA